MIKKTANSIAAKLLSQAGIVINGPNPWDIQVHNDDAFSRVLRKGSLGLGESYMEGWWDCESIDSLLFRLLRANLDIAVEEYLNPVFYFLAYHVHDLASLFYNLQNKARSKIVGYKHYDLGNELFTRMLDPTMCYSCAYWKGGDTLEDAQLAKLALVCGKLQLQPGMRILDIGCGWGSFAHYAAKHHGVSVVGVTISKEQKKLAEERCAGLPVEIRLQDYRDIDEKFDCIVSIGMFEHVGSKNYRTYMETVSRCLDDDGLFLLHTIGGNSARKASDPWINKYIFPNGLIPSVDQIAKAYQGLLYMEDWHNFGADYDKTLMAWYDNFNAHWDELKELYDERFRRMWHFYLLSCAGAFRARDLQLWQVVLSKRGIVNGYRSIR